MSFNELTKKEKTPPITSLHTNFVIADSCSKFFLFFSFIGKGGPLRLRLNELLYKGRRKKYSSFLFEELLRGNSSSWNCWLFGRVSATNESIAKRTKDDGTKVDILAEVFTHSCGCSSSTLIIQEWRGCLEGWPRLEFCCFRNSTFRDIRIIREFRSSSRQFQNFDKRFNTINAYPFIRRLSRTSFFLLLSITFTTVFPPLLLFHLRNAMF